MRLAHLLPLVAAVFTTGCFAPMDEAGEDVGETADAIAVSGADAARILDLVNYPGTDVATLNTAVGLDSRAAKNIVAHRNGADGKALTADDNLFGDIAELDAISYVAATAFTKLTTYATAHPAPSAESVEGVFFKGWESEAVRWGLNHATVAELDGEVGLASRAAKNLAAAAPFTNVTAAGKVAQVGTAALQKLKAHAGAWWSEMNDGGVCAAEVAQDVASSIDKVLYMSESDRPVTSVSVSSTKKGAITAEELRALVGLPAGTPAEVRSADWFFRCDNFYSDDAAVTGQAKCEALESALTQDLTDLTVIRFGHIEIEVYVVGRTSCGEIAGVSTFVVET